MIESYNIHQRPNYQAKVNIYVKTSNLSQFPINFEERIDKEKDITISHQITIDVTKKYLLYTYTITAQ